MASNKDALRAVSLATSGSVPQEPWRQLEQSVTDALARLHEAGYPGGELVLDSNDEQIVIWEMPELPEAGPGSRVAFDADGRLLGLATRTNRWYEWYAPRAANSWMFFAANVTTDRTLFIKDWVDSLAR